MLCQRNAVDVSVIHLLDMTSSTAIACKKALHPLPTPPPQLSKLFLMKTRSSNCSNDLNLVQSFMGKRIGDLIVGEKGILSWFWRHR